MCQGILKATKSVLAKKWKKNYRMGEPWVWYLHTLFLLANYYYLSKSIF